MLIYIPITQVAHNKSRSKEAQKYVPDLAHLHAPKKKSLHGRLIYLEN
jgi:hypothetical protein